MKPIPLVEQQEQQPDQRPQFEFPAEYRRHRTQERLTAEYRQRATWTAEKLRYRQYVRNGLPMDVMMRTRRVVSRYWWVILAAYWAYRRTW